MGRFLRWLLVITMSFIVFFLLFYLVLVYRCGFGETNFFLERVFMSYVYKDKTRGGFAKESFLGEKPFVEDRIRIHGLFLGVWGGRYYLMTAYGIQVFVPIPGDGAVLYKTLDICDDREVIRGLFDTSDGLTPMWLSEKTQVDADSWLNDLSLKKRVFVNVSYLASDQGKFIKRFRYIHSTNGLPNMPSGRFNMLCVN